MKNIIFTIVLFSIYLLSFNSINAQNTPAPSNTIDFTDWLFIQSDKALQIRYGIDKREGDTAYLQLQFRVKSDDEVHCRSSICDGYVLFMTHKDIKQEKDIEHHLYFAPSFTGDKIYNYPTLIPIEIKTWADGSKRFIDKKLGLMYSLADGTSDQLRYFYYCADYQLNNGVEHRCRDFDMSKAVRISESNYSEN